MQYLLKEIEDLPNIKKIKKIAQSLAMLDAIVMPEWEYRYFSFDAHWDKDEMMASMRNGEGNEYFILFNNDGVVGKLFSKDRPLDTNQTKNILKNIPSKFSSFIGEAAFNMDDISFCFWNINNNWSSLPNSTEIPYLNFLTGNSKLYKQWADEYYEDDFDLNSINKILEYKPISKEIVQKLNKNITFDNLIEEINEIGYPII